MSHSRYALFGLALLASGCARSGELPKTYPASGSVVYKGGAPMKSGVVHFASPTDNLLRILGDIQEDGSFKLETIKDRARAAGAPEGEYQVSVQPPLEGGHRGVPPIPLPLPYKVEPKENQFRIVLDVGPPRS